MKKWKYVKESPKINFDEYLKLKIDEPTTVKIKFMEIVKKYVDGDMRSVFQGTVFEENDKATEKILIIKNFENVQFLKKKISGKKVIKIQITRHYNEEIMETFFDIKVLKNN